MYFWSIFICVLEYLSTAIYSVIGAISSFENAKQLSEIFSRVSKMSAEFAKLDIWTNIFTYSSRQVIIGFFFFFPVGVLVVWIYFFYLF